MKRTVSLLSVVILGTLLAAPGARGQWVQTNGPNGGYIRSFVENGTNLYVAVDKPTNGGYGVFRSTDSGKSWSPKNNGLTNTNVWALAVSGTNLFAGTYGGGVFLSSDSGATWTASNNGLTNKSVQALAVSGSLLFAGSSDGIFTSTNNGVSWDSVWTANVICFNINGTNVFVGTYGQGVLTSSNNGTSWTADTNGLTNNKIYALAITGDTILAGSWGGGVFVSTNNGSNWTSDTTGLGGAGLHGGLYEYSLAVNNNNNFFVGTQEGGIYRSTNRGASWSTANDGLTNTFGTAFLVSGNNIFAGTYNGIFVSTNNGTTWSDVSNGLPVNTNVQAFAVLGADSPSPILCAGEGSNFTGNYLGGFFFSTDEGSTWQASSGLAPNSDITALTVSGANSATPVLFAGTAGNLPGLTGLIFRSSDSGSTWSRATSHLPATLEVTALASIGVETSTPIIFAGTLNRGVSRSLDNGTTWAPADSGLTSNAITCFAVMGSYSPSPTMFVGTFGNGVFESTDTGNLWIPSGQGLDDMDVQALAVMGDNTRSPILFAAEYTGVYLSIDSGRSWSHSGLDTNRIQTLAVSGSYLFAGDYNGGVYLSTDSGRSWKTEGLSNFEIQTLAILGKNLYAGTYGSGVWRRPLSDFGISSVAQNQPASAEQLSIFPNPASNRATIEFTTSSPGYADVRVVNELGAEVARVFSGELGAGEHSFAWSPPPGLAAGMYECLVRRNGSVGRISILLK